MNWLTPFNILSRIYLHLGFSIRHLSIISSVLPRERQTSTNEVGLPVTLLSNASLLFINTTSHVPSSILSSTLEQFHPSSFPEIEFLKTSSSATTEWDTMQNISLIQVISGRTVDESPWTTNLLALRESTLRSMFIKTDMIRFSFSSTILMADDGSVSGASPTHQELAHSPISDGGASDGHREGIPSASRTSPWSPHSTPNVPDIKRSSAGV